MTPEAPTALRERVRVGRHGVREMDTIKQMWRRGCREMVGKRLMYRELVP